ncbi:hypothetical protein SERLA73DRAFT_188142 [Serpula lacrymans var. lacrymans S7.3]|uniref:Thioesterase domain-containing protein n=2 Tax=Serpula lacrymans var. lacrymans TaxID=341189 RepID=F8QAU1_SERL3|nr:uncharacterized protein SERLADRAFT_478147 [Serpula lacrymans var. lacrymans S7.9]EGN94327.1 hypothetical protein SERLA73DRAFT_188142 [Serpula lacrymans var. lacrymans S7.3]EGO19814.1 hypothetical protein SERLADRAFT_478147 [Serpula lacrymans var. lacrymans S7.9]
MLPPNDLSLIEGNTSLDFKQVLFRSLDERRNKAISPKGFEREITSRLTWKEVSLVRKAEEPEKLEGRVVMEIIVEEDMLNAADNLHGGCSGLLVDNCSTMANVVLGQAMGEEAKLGVSLSINIMYHSPAALGDKLRIVSTTLTMGARAMSSRCEIWNDTRHRLVVSGVHSKMAGSPPKGAPIMAKL